MYSFCYMVFWSSRFFLNGSIIFMISKWRWSLNIAVKVNLSACFLKMSQIKLLIWLNKSVLILVKEAFLMTHPTPFTAWTSLWFLLYFPDPSIFFFGKQYLNTICSFMNQIWLPSHHLLSIECTEGTWDRSAMFKSPNIKNKQQTH